MRGRGKREADQKWMQIAVIIFIIVVVFFSTELFWSLFKQRKEEKEGSSLKLRVAQWDDVRKWIYRQIKFWLSRGMKHIPILFDTKIMSYLSTGLHKWFV